MPWMLPARSDWIIRSENVGSLILLLFESINTVTLCDTCQVDEHMKEGRDQPAASPKISKFVHIMKSCCSLQWNHPITQCFYLRATTNFYPGYPLIGK